MQATPVKQFTKFTSWQNSNNNSLIVSPEVSIDVPNASVSFIQTFQEERKYQSPDLVRIHKLSRIDGYDVDKNICNKSIERYGIICIPEIGGLNAGYKSFLQLI